MVIARPLTTWFAPMLTQRKAWMAETSIPTSTATANPNHGFPVTIVAENPEKAPRSISPSSPRLRTPAFSVRISPSVA